jgi:hypothetical protein
MAPGDTGDLSGPHLRYARLGEDPHVSAEDTLRTALELARQIEELLEDTRSVVGSVEDPRAHSTRMARAMAASLVDELEVLARPARKSGVA